jgi:hypothetical protein
MPSGLPDFLVGSFAGIDHVHASEWAEQRKVETTAVGSLELAGGTIAQRFDELDREHPIKMLNLFMTDPASGEVLLYAFDSFGFPPDPPARGASGADRIELVRRTERGHSRTAFVRTEAGFDWHKQYRRSDGDPWQDVVTGSLRRISDG